MWGDAAKVYFHSFFVLQTDPRHVDSGAGLSGGLTSWAALCSLSIWSAPQAYHFKFTWRKSGIWLTHVGVILLLLGELLERGSSSRTTTWPWITGNQKLQRERFAVQRARPPRTRPLTRSSTTVVAIPRRVLADGPALQQPSKLPFQVVTKEYYPNATLQVAAKDAPNAAPSLRHPGQ